jgi:hypothetical protein
MVEVTLIAEAGDTLDATRSPMLLLGRYRVGIPLGAGGHGTVYEAFDERLNEHVALKRINAQSASLTARIRREVAVLRALKLPGVVRLLDAWTDGDAHFLVLERIHGKPFPGSSEPTPWPVLKPTVLALCTTLAAIHAEGYVHRDIKPGNVLVDAHGTPTVLDFGIARALSVAARLTGEGAIIGTPTYLAPEQVQSGAVGPYTDLYALGVMIYEALSGVLPFQGKTLRSALFARVLRAAPSLAEHCPNLPHYVIATVDALLQRDPARRPSSAQAVAEALEHGDTTNPPAPLRLPWLGSRAPIAALVEGALAGQSAAITGPGRSRLLAEAHARLLKRHRTVQWVPAGKAPFSSLLTLCPRFLASPQSTLRAVSQALQAHLSERLTQGLVLIIDDLNTPDPQSRVLLDRLALDHPILGATDGVTQIELQPFTAHDMQALFEGPSLLLHLPEDAATALHQRTQGQPTAVLSELNAWLDRGIARRNGPMIRVDRTGLDRLSISARQRRADGPPPPGLEALHPSARRLIDLLSMLDQPVEAVRLATALSQPLWQVEANLAQLQALGWAHTHPNGATAHTPGYWPQGDPDHLAALHAAAAQVITPGSPGRLEHLRRSGDFDAWIHSCLTHGRQARAKGQPSHALALLMEGLLASEQAPEHPHRSALIEEVVDTAVSDGRSAPIDEALVLLARPALSASTTDAQTLLEAALAVSNAPGPRALRMADSVPQMATPIGERARQRVRQRAAGMNAVPIHADVVGSLDHWLSAHPNERPWVLRWRSRLAYRQSRFPEAAALATQAALSDEGSAYAVADALAAASAWMEARRPQKALPLARQARAHAAELRHVAYEARAIWLERALRYRSADAIEPWPALADVAARHTQAGSLGPLILLNEAAIAWRLDQLEPAQRWATAAYDAWTRQGQPAGAALASALIVQCGGPGEPHEIQARATDAPVGIRQQVHALLAGPIDRQLPSAATVWRAEVLAPIEVGASGTWLK